MMSSTHRSLSSKKRTFYNMLGLILIPLHASRHDTYGVGELFVSHSLLGKNSGCEHGFEHANPNCSVCFLI